LIPTHDEIQQLTVPFIILFTKLQLGFEHLPMTFSKRNDKTHPGEVIPYARLNEIMELESRQRLEKLHWPVRFIAYGVSATKQCSRV
jgi:hypothetical protein